MRILVIGGTGFLGRKIVEAARAAGHELTLFNRNQSAPGLFPDVDSIVGDRAKDISALRGRRWDAVIDLCGYALNDVACSVETLSGQVDLYVYISSVMAYRNWGAPRQREGSPLYAEKGAAFMGSDTASYRARRAACDRFVRERLPGRTLVIRPGLIVGPGDPAETLSYWLMRSVRGGEALAPGDPERVVQAIDVRDLARWIVFMTAQRRVGVFNACGRGIAMKRLLDVCRTVSHGRVKFVWVNNRFLLKELSSRRDIRERPLQFLETLPFWIPGLDDRFDSAAAGKNGLVRRSLFETARDTFALMGEARPLAHAFLGPDREAALLAEWRRRPRKK